MKVKIMKSRVFSLSLIFSGAILLLINLYGLTQNIRPSVFNNEDLRFSIDKQISPELFLLQSKLDKNETELEYAIRLTTLISSSLVHIDWLKPPSEKYNQRIPLWENYFIYFVYLFFDIPEFDRYHFVDYKKSIKRGIGICGDASMVMSQLLTENGIANKIITFPGHVVISVDDHFNYIFDPDFGVVIPSSSNDLTRNKTIVNKAYLHKGYKTQDVNDLNIIYSKKFKKWAGVKHLIANKYYFEKAAYLLKWPLPLFMVFWGLYILFNKTKKGM